MQEEPPKNETDTNNQYDEPPEDHTVTSDPAQEITSVGPTVTIVQAPYVQANDGRFDKVSWKEVIFIFVKELVGMSIFTYVACIANTNMISLGFVYALLQASTEISSSGGLHLNPAITLGAAISGRMKPILILPMTLAQFIGCLLGGSFCRGSQTDAQFIGKRPSFFRHQIFYVHDDEDLIRYCFGEFLMTAILVSVFLRLFPLRTRQLPANEKERQESENRKYIHALFVGLTIVSVTGVLFQTTYVGLMNPFRAFGPLAVWVTTVVDGDSPEVNKTSDLWRGHWVYWIGPIVGGSLAGVVDRLKRLNIQPSLF